ncbi:MAG: rhomboid family intramembrane serine protease [Candidatus Eisenbacteria bacterium]
MIRVRIADREAVFPDQEWEARVAAGAVPPEALVFSREMTRGLWQRADTLPLYAFFRKGGEDERAERGLPAVEQVPFRELPQVAFPRRGLSSTEILLALNLAVALGLLLAWQTQYHDRLFRLAYTFYNLFVERYVPVGFFATLFMHANLGHLGANMITLVPASAFIEYLYGRQVLLIYLLTGLSGAIVSFLAKGHGPMSVGASGAVYGLIGAFAGFTFRHLGHFPRWHRWKALRIYVPALALATLPSILNADWRAHVGGFLAGVLLGFLLRLDERGRKLLLPGSSRPSRRERRWVRDE